MGDGYNWYLEKVRTGFDPINEANTSRYVHEILVRCLEWPFESIVPQASKRGFIDYKLTYEKPPAEIHVEVKPLGRTLNEDMIRKYVATPGPTRQVFNIGALTNFREWRIFISGSRVREVAQKSFVELRRIEIEDRTTIDYVREVIGYSKNGNLTKIRESLADTFEIVEALLYSDEAVAAIRRALFDIRDNHGLVIPVPQSERTRDHVDQFLKVQWEGDCPFTLAKFRQALGSELVASAVTKRLAQILECRTNLSRVHGTIRELIETKNEEFRRLDEE